MLKHKGTIILLFFLQPNKIQSWQVLAQLRFNQENTLVWREGRRQWGMSYRKALLLSLLHSLFLLLPRNPDLCLQALQSPPPIHSTHSQELVNSSNDCFFQWRQLTACACTTRSNSFLSPTWNSLSMSSIPSPAQPDSPFFPRASRSPAQSVEGSLLLQCCTPSRMYKNPTSAWPGVLSSTCCWMP